MASRSPLLDAAIQAHRQGNLARAEGLYRLLLERSPKEADALHLLGLALYRRGRHREALDHISEAVAVRPEAALYRGNLARVLAATDRLVEAERSLRAAIVIDSGNADFHYDLGVILIRDGRPGDAVPCFLRAVELSPPHSRAHNNLGSALERLGRLQEAEAHFRIAATLEPALAEAHANLGALLCRRGRAAEAMAALRKALAVAPDFPEALNTLGLVLAAHGDWAAAEAAFHRALALDPNYPDAYNNLGVLLTDRGRWDDAVAMLDMALQRKPRYGEAETNRGNALLALGRVADAEAAYRRALAIAPGEAETEYNLGLARLLAGRLEEGWGGYERRAERRGAAIRPFAQPLWLGEALDERVLLVHAEQGFGDTIQFCRYVPLLPATRVVLEVPRPLLRLVSTLPGGAEVVACGEALPRFDVHCPLPSLPSRAGTTLAGIPATVPYLFPDPAAAGKWRSRLAGERGLKVGISWSGNPEFPADKRRSISPALLRPLAEVSGVVFVSLQPGVPPAGLPLLSFPRELNDFADTAALMAALDLVISVDTAAIHLAGALGRPAWLLNRFDTCWRWMLGRTDSPWYPTLRLFRQERPGDWPGVLEAVKAALTGVVADIRHLLPGRPGGSGASTHLPQEFAEKKPGKGSALDPPGPHGGPEAQGPPI